MIQSSSTGCLPSDEVQDEGKPVTVQLVECRELNTATVALATVGYVEDLTAKLQIGKKVKNY